MTTFKLIRTSEFTVETKKYTNHVVAHKGRVININSLSLVDAPEIKITVDATAKTVTVDGPFSVVSRPYLDPTTNLPTQGLSIMPKFDLAIDAF